MSAESSILSATLPPLSSFNQELTPYWLTLSVFFDLFLGLIPFALLTLAYGPLTLRAYEKTPTGKLSHPITYLTFSWVKLIGWGIMLGVLGDLLLSVGWHSPLSWQGFVYDLIYARANGQPNGAHILSYIGIPIFGFIVTYKFNDNQGTMKLVGNIFLGGSAALFLGAVHEIIWVCFYYSAYWQYLNWGLLPEVIRDISFAVMCVLLILTFWKFPGRTISLKVFQWPIIAYTIFCLGWFLIPFFFGYHVLPITTINNPAYANNLYQETPWFGLWWVNGLEVLSWVFLYVWFMVIVIRHK